MFAHCFDSNLLRVPNMIVLLIQRSSRSPAVCCINAFFCCKTTILLTEWQTESQCTQSAVWSTTHWVKQTQMTDFLMTMLLEDTGKCLTTHLVRMSPKTELGAWEQNEQSCIVSSTSLFLLCCFIQFVWSLHLRVNRMCWEPYVICLWKSTAAPGDKIHKVSANFYSIQKKETPFLHW